MSVDLTAPAADDTVPERHALLAAWLWRLAPVLSGLAALALTLPTLGRKSLVFAEARTAEIAGGTWSELRRLVRGEEAPHAVNDLVVWTWSQAVGGADWALRVPSAAAGAIAVGLTCALGIRLLGRVAGVVAAGALGTALAWITWSQSAGSTTLAVAFALAATLAFLSAVEHPRALTWSAWAVPALAAVALDLLTGAIVVAHVAAYATARRGLGERAALVAGATVVLGAIAIALVVVSEADLLSNPSGAPDGELVRAPWELVGNNPVVLVLAGAGLVRLVLRAVAEREWQPTAVLLGVWITSVLLIGLAVAAARPALEARHLAVAAPALAILVAAAIVAEPRWIAVALVALLGLTAGVRYADWVDGPSVEGWREAAATISRERDPAEAVVVRPVRQAIALEHYAGEGVADGFVRGPRVWIVLAETDAGRRLELARDTVSPPRYALRAERRFGERLWLQVWERP
jgi:mannosyltransferase